MKESFEVATNGDVKKVEVELDVQPFEDYASLVPFSAPADGTKQLYVSLSKADFEELGSPSKLNVSVSAA